jgi:hypothetical protein
MRTGMKPLARGPIACSLRWQPRRPEELPRPFGCRAVREFSRMRVVSRVPAPRITTGALKSMVSRVLASITRTPAARPVAGSRTTSDTTEYGRMVSLPVSRAG